MECREICRGLQLNAMALPSLAMGTAIALPLHCRGSPWALLATGTVSEQGKMKWYYLQHKEMFVLCTAVFVTLS